jgi:hypothetical protein
MPTMSLRPGEIFAGYSIERELGTGGMGSVYLAHHPRLPRFDALKLPTRSRSWTTPTSSPCTTAARTAVSCG